MPLYCGGCDNRLGGLPPFADQPWEGKTPSRLLYVHFGYDDGKGQLARHRCLIAGTPLCGAAAAVLIVGSLCFVLSDATLAMLNFGPKKTFPLKCFNIGTYYAAQVLLASTILFF